MKKDEGSVHRLFSLILVAWMVMLVGVLFVYAKVGLVDQRLEDGLMQANLSAILIDPYQYGGTGELVFADVAEITENFKRCLDACIEGAEILDFRLYEVRTNGILETVCDGVEKGASRSYDIGAFVVAPDGTEIVSSSIYSKIAAPVEFGFGIEVTAVKEHCVDVIVSEGMEDEET